MTLSELYTMPVEKLGVGSRGYVLGAVADGAKLKYLVCSDDEENDYFICVDSVISFDERIVYNGEATKKPKERALRLGAPCCNEQGRLLGRIEEIYIKNYVLKSARIGGKRYAFDRLVIGDITIVKSRRRDDASARIAVKDLFIDAVCS